MNPDEILRSKHPEENPEGLLSALLKAYTEVDTAFASESGRLAN
jgi:hypothetical protein